MYKCESCNYSTDRLSNWNKHLVTKKHKIATNTDMDSNVTPKLHRCINCNKQYKFRSGLSKHRLVCDIKNDLGMEEKNQQIEELCKLLERTITKNQENFEKLLPKIGNNITNNINGMTINVFLNDYCKDAMNMSEFLDKINFTVDDLYYTSENGYLKGITNIFVKNLSELPVTSRPIHCSDKKKLEFYVKDSDNWRLDKENNRIQKSIDTLSKKQVAAIKIWEESYPNWMADENLTNEYISLVQTVTSIDSKDNDSFFKDLSNKVMLTKEQIAYK